MIINNNYNNRNIVIIYILFLYYTKFNIIKCLFFFDIFLSFTQNMLIFYGGCNKKNI